MSGINVKFEKGRISYTAEAAVTGGQVVDPGAGKRTVKPAAADSERILGVALTDAAPAASPTPGVLVATTDVVTVASGMGCVPVVSDGSAAVGDLVVSAGGGAVKKAAGTEGIGAIVGRVKEQLSDDGKSVLVDLGL
ncbi:hypothetical protein [Prescottella equi]|uniref:Scaffolding protein n=1 Tax=Prescottella equi ATCC 33707 TaxID=525370 RepID=E9T078_RHOHA|nr:hypothetical protein [Prescottella equi]EGD24661.1 hypothetical protein HMPREF0724_11779 [Prescottella equi ATCC 33707]